MYYSAHLPLRIYPLMKTFFHTIVCAKCNFFLNTDIVKTDFYKKVKNQAEIV